MTIAAFRTGSRRYLERPPSNCIAARRAWDSFAEDGHVEWMQLLDGWWGCMRPGAEGVEELEAVHFRRTKPKST